MTGIERIDSRAPTERRDKRLTVELILSGFFRSGTTALWEAARRSNPDVEVFYEPCHEQLLRHVRDFGESGGAPHPVHGLPLWSNYLAYDGLTEALQEGHPGTWYLPDAREATRTIAVFNERVPARTFIQVNRWGHLLPKLQRETGLPYIHVVRAPSDVQASMRRYHQRDGAWPKRLAKQWLWRWVRGRAFSVDRRFAELCNRGVIPQAVSRGRPSPDDRFLAVWLAENVAVADAPGTGNSIVFLYETAARAPATIRECTRNRTGVDIDMESVFAARPARRHAWPEDLEWLRRFGERFSVAEHVAPVLELAEREVSNAGA